MTAIVVAIVVSLLLVVGVRLGCTAVSARRDLADGSGRCREAQFGSSVWRCGLVAAHRGACNEHGDVFHPANTLLVSKALKRRFMWPKLCVACLGTGSALLHDDEGPLCPRHTERLARIERLERDL